MNPSEDRMNFRGVLLTHLIFERKAHLDKAIDPAGGSWYVESLTDELARKAWTAFQEIEKQGGDSLCLVAGIPQQESEQIAQQRKANLSTRKDVLIGTNMYPNLDEKPLEIRELDPAAQKARADEVARYRITQGGNGVSPLGKAAETLAKFPSWHHASHDRSRRLRRDSRRWNKVPSRKATQESVSNL